MKMKSMYFEENLSLKTIGDYRFNFKVPYTKGNNSEIYKATKNGQYSEIYLVKCVKRSFAETIIDLVYKERDNREKFTLTNAIILKEHDIQTENHLYSFYKFYDSFSIEELIKTPPFELNYQKKLKIVKLLSLNLLKLHENKIIHRNLNPSHILVSKQFNELKFCGQKNIYLIKDSLPNISIGAPPNSAPEMNANINIQTNNDDKDDIYSFGIIVLEFLTGKTNFIDKGRNLITEMASLTPGIKSLLLKCLEPNPKLRISSKEISNPLFNFFDEENRSFEIYRKETIFPYIKTNDKLLGKGKYGIVYEVVNQNTKEIFAIKEINMCMMNNSKQERDIILDEINLLYELKDKGFVNKIIEAFYCEDNLCLVLEKCNGGTLQEYIEQLRCNNKKIKLEDVRLIAWNIAEGLNILHKRKIIHRDLKPSNILLIKDEATKEIIDCKISDLGYGKKLDESGIATTILGTQIYYAPEMWRYLKHEILYYTNKIDVYAFGLILYFIIFGESAYDYYVKTNRLEEFKKGNIELPTESNIPNSLLELLKSCLIQIPEKRISFEEIIKSDFFLFKQIERFPNINILQGRKYNFEKDHSYGYICEDLNIWVKVYKEECLKVADMIKYIEREIDFLYKSKYISHIVPMLQFGYISNTIALSFKYCNGRNLENLNDSRRLCNNISPNLNKPNFSHQEIKCVSKCLVEFIDDMHGKTFIHRSINPRHILLILDMESNLIKEAKICGFRGSKSENLDKSKSGFIDLNIECFEDPLAEEFGFNTGSDLWSIGMVIYFMLFSKTPFELKAELKDLRLKGFINISPEIDTNISKFINYCLKKRSEKELSKLLIKEDLLREMIFL